MKQSVKTGFVVIGTIAIVAGSLLIPRQMIVASDQKQDGQVNAAEKEYYTGALEAYAGEDDFYTRMMLLTGKWVSREERLATTVYDALDAYGAIPSKELGIKIDGESAGVNIKALDTIRRISLDYWKDERMYSKPAFLAWGNAVRTVCNLTAFDLMPEVLNLYYESWGLQKANVYRYTDLLLRKYECDVARLEFESAGWNAKAELLVDTATGNFVGLWVSYDEEMALRWLQELERLEAEWVDATEYPEEKVKTLQSELEKYRQWKKIFLTGESVTTEEGKTVKVPLSSSHADRTVLDANVAEFLNRIGFFVEGTVTKNEEFAGIARVPHTAVSTGDALTYAYIVTENSSNKKFYFVISSSEGGFEAYFSPMTEKTSGNNLTEQ